MIVEISTIRSLNLFAEKQNNSDHKTMSLLFISSILDLQIYFFDVRNLENYLVSALSFRLFEYIIHMSFNGIF